MKIGYIGGFWATNIGNSFYDLGAISLLEKLFGNKNVFFIPDMANWFWNVKDNYEPLHDVKLDICLFSGPLFNRGIRKYSKIFDSLVSKDIKIGFLTAGASKYTEDERDEVIEFLNQYKESIHFISTRDSETYRLYREFGINIYDGLCTSMFLNDAVNLPILKKDYSVFNFNILKEPYINIEKDEIKITKRDSFFKFQQEFMHYDIVRTNHETFTRFKKLLFNRPNMYYCDIPFGYLTIYKNAKYVFSDRVHTCAATLILGGTAMYIKGSKRSHDGRNNLFKRIGVEDIYKKPTNLDFNFINHEKEKMMDFIKNIMEESK